MIYIDTSCLLKLLWDEVESENVRAAVHSESHVAVSSLVELETEIQLKAATLGGKMRIGQLRQFQAKLNAMRHIDPFHFRTLPAAVFPTALRQHRHGNGFYCRSLDRLHLAAMTELKLNRLMTTDVLQAKAAEALGYQVLSPNRNSP